MRPHLASIRRLAAVGADLLVRTIALRVVISLSTAIAARIGTVEVAAHEVAFAVWSLLALGLDAIAIAAQAMTGHRLGADRPDEARAAGNRMIELGVVLGVGFGLVVVLLRPVLPERVQRRPGRDLRGRIPAVVRGRHAAAATRWCSCSTAC